MTQTLGNTPANQIMPQIRAGAASITPSNRFVTFSQPMPNANYVVILEPSIPTLSVTGKTPQGFSVSGHTSVVAQWIAVAHI